MIQLDKHYRIEADSNNVTLIYNKEKEVTFKNKETQQEETKTVLEKDEWYYPNLKGALRKYMNQELKYCESIQHVLTRIDEIETIINNIVIVK